MYSQEPAMAEEWQKETPKGADLPEKVSGKESAMKRRLGGEKKSK